MVPAPVTTLPTQPARGGGQAGKGHPRGGGQAHYYAFPGRTEAVASLVVIKDMSHNSLDTYIYVSTPVGHSIVVDHVYRSGLVTIEVYKTRVDLLLLNMVDDVILGMDWLSPYHTILDCPSKTVTLAMTRLEWRGSLGHVPSRVVSFLKAQWMVEKGCLAYLAFVRC
ncbi:uncharacterized protein [Nicotiana tomentosiformis]|uniref:uncharacterized protein n=1 Tax=Nicotiana tomentosiformis TaxID=4098 RepID=UPI00388C44C4